MINVTSTNISPEICQRFNEISFLLSGARNVSARYRLNESAAQLLLIQAKHTLIFFRINFIMHCTPGHHQRSEDKEKSHTNNSGAATLLFKETGCLIQNTAVDASVCDRCL